VKDDVRAKAVHGHAVHEASVEIAERFFRRQKIRKTISKTDLFPVLGEIGIDVAAVIFRHENELAGRAEIRREIFCGLMSCENSGRASAPHLHRTIGRSFGRDGQLERFLIWRLNDELVVLDGRFDQRQGGELALRDEIAAGVGEKKSSVVFESERHRAGCGDFDAPSSFDGIDEQTAHGDVAHAAITFRREFPVCRLGEQPRCGVFARNWQELQFFVFARGSA